jgi:HTH-type transcriptional regulator / antitoxin HigA
METRSKHTARRNTDDKYMQLVRTFPLRPIRTDAGLDRAIAVVDSLIDRADLDAGEEDYLDVLSDLIHKYEAERDPVAHVTEADVLRFLLETNEMAQAELARKSGIAESTISEILAGKRKLSRRHISKLSKVFHVSAAVFFADAEEMGYERVAKTLSRRSGLKIFRRVRP